MRNVLSLLFCLAAFLALIPAAHIGGARGGGGAPAPRAADSPTALKQATRDTVVRRARDPRNAFQRRQQASAGPYPTCNGLTPATGIVRDHAVYRNTVGLSPGSSFAISNQPNLEACIRQCCALPTCNVVTYDEINMSTCRLYSQTAGQVNYAAGSFTTVINQATCQSNSGNAMGAGCCNAPLSFP